eukprot:TRINITY_DN20755_c0_g1_i1.p1 TRINITY_DN20755_c0_g1~~TRINITY_DN20755_c0_g1_i1.p1  ORF type:complete len:205 (-),score=18.42 TRINITY_DN20755_c0_g1_i1:1-615(-)
MAGAARACWRRYERALAANPLRTKMATSFSLMGGGDVLAQYLGAESNEWSWDSTRTASMMGLGLVGHAPYFHNWYRLLDKRFVGTDTRTVLSKVGLELVTAGPLYLTIVLSYTAAVADARATEKGSSVGTLATAAGKNIRENFLVLYTGGVSFHAVVQCVNFAFVPSRQRILYDNAVSLGWKTVLSFFANRVVPKDDAPQDVVK